MSDKKILLVLLQIGLTIDWIRNDKICESIIPDAMTQMQNNTIVIFQKNQVWFLFGSETDANQLQGPCAISEIYEGMSGPIDAAVTIKTHEEQDLSEFIGTSIYFGGGNFYTFRNLRPYQVEWAAIVYLPVKGVQAKMGEYSIDNKITNALMVQTISASYFDPTEHKTKLIFANGAILGYSFISGYDYDNPDFSSLQKEFQKYGVSALPNGITAALTLVSKAQIKVYFFYGSYYCSIDLNENNKNQSCVLRHVSLFFGCKIVVTKSGNCVAPAPVKTENSTVRQGVGSSVKLDPAFFDLNETTPTTTMSEEMTATIETTENCANPLAIYSILCHIILNLLIFLFIQILI